MTPWTIVRQVHLSIGILQARILEWVAMPYSRGSSQHRDQTQVIKTKSPKPRSPALQVDSSPSEPPEKPKNTGVVSPTLLWEIFLTQEDLWSSGLQADSLPAEPPEKPKNTGVGSLSLLQWIFATQELNRGLLHCRQILYQLS